MSSRGFVVASLLLCAGIAHADAKATSLDHYIKGRKAYVAASFEVAISEFERAYAAYPAPEYLHDIAQAYRRLDRCDAVGYFERYLAAKPDAKNKTDVERQIAALSRRCSPTPAPPAPPAPVESAASPSTPAPAPPRVAVVDAATVATPDSSISTTARSAAPPSLYALTASAGVALLDAGPVVMPPVGQFELGARRRVLVAPVDVNAGVSFSLGHLPFDDTSTGTVWLFSPELVGEARYTVYPRWSITGTVGAGAMVMTGLAEGNPFTTDAMDSGTITTARVRASVGVAYIASDRLTVHVAPLGYQWSPRRDALASDINALHGLASRPESRWAYEHDERGNWRPGAPRNAFTSGCG